MFFSKFVEGARAYLGKNMCAGWKQKVFYKKFEIRQGLDGDKGIGFRASENKTDSEYSARSFPKRDLSLVQ